MEIIKVSKGCLSSHDRLSKQKKIFKNRAKKARNLKRRELRGVFGSIEKKAENMKAKINKRYDLESVFMETMRENSHKRTHSINKPLKD